MRIHSDILTGQHFIDAAKNAGVTLIDCVQKGSKSRARAFDFYLSGHGVSGGQWGNGSYKSATWDEWGMVLAELFAVDPDARIAGVYESAAHFHWATDNRFVGLTPASQHLRHRWDGYPMTGREATAAGYQERWCDCGAAQRWMLPGNTFAELIGA